MDIKTRALRHAALSDERRLLIVDHLVSSDLTVADLAEVSDMPGNLLAHHLDVLEDAGLIMRRTSEGDQRRRYVTLCWEQIPSAVAQPTSLPKRVVFVCTHNSARSQFASALWAKSTGSRAVSAGARPADAVHPKAVKVASEFDVDISGFVPSHYESLPSEIGLIVSVCDRANEGHLPAADRHLHWSVPDPVPVGTVDAFRSAFADIAKRIGHLAGGV